VVAGNE
jgi:hypothetical protein